MGSAISFSDTTKVQELLAQLVAREESNPEVKPTITPTAGGPREITWGAESRLVIPIHVRFAGFSNGYCRLAVIQSAPASGELVPLPMSANYMSCERIEKIAEADLNHDGIPDFVFAATVPSNRHPEFVQEGVVYVSDARKRGYCYAPLASRAATMYPDGFRGMKTIAAAIESEVKRLGKKVLACADASGPSP